MSEEIKETLESFRQSFNYGSRTDLLFKWLGSRNLSDKEAAEFFRGLLEKLGDAFDSGNYGEVYQHCFGWQVYGYTPKEGTQPQFKYDVAPWTPLKKLHSGLTPSCSQPQGASGAGHPPPPGSHRRQAEGHTRPAQGGAGGPACARASRSPRHHCGLSGVVRRLMPPN